MKAVQPRHSAEEFKEWGDRLYEEQVRPNLTPDDHGKFVAIDVEGRGFESADDSLTARERLRERIPDAQIWLKRIGYDAAIRGGMNASFGACPASSRPSDEVANGPRYPLEEFSHRGNAIFNEQIAEQVRSADPLDFVAINIETGDFEVAPEQRTAIFRLRDRSDDANPQIWIRRVGTEISHRVGRSHQ